MMPGRENRGGVSLVLRLAARIAYFAAVGLAVAILYVSLAAVGAEAQSDVEDWDDVTEDRYDSAETDAANRDITEAQEQRDAAIEGEESLDCTLCYEAREYQEQRDAATDATYAGTAELVDARAQAIEAAPGNSEEELNEKLDALDTLESYAEEWSPDGPNDGEADTIEVEAARAEVEGQLAAVEEDDDGSSDSSDEGGGGSGGGSNVEDAEGDEETEEETEEETSGEDMSGAASGGGGDSGSGDSSGGNDNGDGPEEPTGDSGGPLAGIFSGSSLASLLAATLVAVGVLYYLVGLLREGLGERARRVGAPAQASAPKPKTSSKSAPAAKPKGAKPTSKDPEPEQPSERSPKEPRSESPRLDKDERSGSVSEASSDEYGEGSAIADRLKRMRGEDGKEPPASSAEELDDLFAEPEDEDDEDR